jgi:ferrochelatase
MDRPAPSAAVPPDAHARGQIGVLLVNLGTPDAPEPAAVRRYLREFLSDRRVIETNPLLWQMILNGIVLPLRPRRVSRAYRAIWNHETDESPLRSITRAQAGRLGTALAADGVAVEWAMRYGTPTIAERLAALQARGCGRILIAPLYPQYSATTTATACDAAFDALKALRHQPALRVLPPYFADAAYIGALGASLRRGLEALQFVPDKLIASFHGLPKSYVDKGDPYADQCAETTRLLRAEMGWDEEHLLLTFQSRFGPTAWLSPYTAQVVPALAKQGVRNLAVVTPGFSVDCLETLEEIAIEAGGRFRAAGGEHFVALPCLNDSAEGMAMIEGLVRRELSGWLHSA